MMIFQVGGHTCIRESQARQCARGSKQRDAAYTHLGILLGLAEQPLRLLQQLQALARQPIEFVPFLLLVAALVAIPIAARQVYTHHVGQAASGSSRHGQGFTLHTCNHQSLAALPGRTHRSCRLSAGGGVVLAVRRPSVRVLITSISGGIMSVRGGSGSAVLQQLIPIHRRRVLLRRLCRLAA